MFLSAGIFLPAGCSFERSYWFCSFFGHLNALLYSFVFLNSFKQPFNNSFRPRISHCYRAESSCRAKRFGRVFSTLFCSRDNLTLTNRPALLLHMWNESGRLRKCLGNLHPSKHWSKVQTHFRKLVPPPSLLRRKVIGNISRSQARNYYFYQLIRKKDSSSYSVCIPKYHQL